MKNLKNIENKMIQENKYNLKENDIVEITFLNKRFNTIQTMKFRVVRLTEKSIYTATINKTGYEFPAGRESYNTVNNYFKNNISHKIN